MKAILGIDTGGTFTDFVLLEEGNVRLHKVLSTPAAPEQAILDGIRQMGLERSLADGKLAIVHGTTVATNATLENRGARTALVTNEGLQDMLLIGRQTRRRLYDLTPPPTDTALDPDLMFGIHARLDATGAPVDSLGEDAVGALMDKLAKAEPEAVAINLLFSYLNPEDERRLAEALQGAGYHVCRSSDVLPLAGEYERGVATWLNARLGPTVSTYLHRLLERTRPCPLSVMQSHGGTLAAEAAADRAVNLLLSGPAGGLCAARSLGEQIGRNRLMTFDMGGTSTDVALVDGDFRLTLEGRIGPWPVAVPMVDMHTIGAGGGSIAWCDEAGMLHVGPRSAGADPGPACYGRGGTAPTVTDANLFLGRLQPAFALGGSLRLDAEAAERALTDLGGHLGLSARETAQGIIALANEHMTQALRVISVQKGHDPADFTLASFGGAGGLHVCALAESLGMSRAVVPRNSGVLSAEGLARAPRQRELIRALPANGADAVAALADELALQGHTALREEGCADEDIHIRVFVDLRYRGQSFQLDVPWDGDIPAAETHFHEQHEHLYGHRLSLPVEWVNVRVQARADAPSPAPPRLSTKHARPSAQATMVELDTPVAVYNRDDLGAGQRLVGPALIREAVATTWLAPGWCLEVHTTGHLLLSGPPSDPD